MYEDDDLGYSRDGTLAQRNSTYMPQTEGQLSTLGNNYDAQSSASRQHRNTLMHSHDDDTPPMSSSTQPSDPRRSEYISSKSKIVIDYADHHRNTLIRQGKRPLEDHEIMTSERSFSQGSSNRRNASISPKYGKKSPIQRQSSITKKNRIGNGVQGVKGRPQPLFID